MTISKTPLRYPGGKQKLWPFIAEIIQTNNIVGCHYVEPFAGGAGVAIELLLNRIVSCIHLNDICPAIHAFWHTVKNQPDELCKRISCASLTIEEWKRQRDIFKNPKSANKIDLGYATLFLNRCNRSGILTGGVIGGLNQNGNWKMDARFSRNNLIKRIENIANQSRNIRIRNWSAEKYILKYIPRLSNTNTLVYCDPPYYNKADRLYTNFYNGDDHLQLAKTIQKNIKCNWVVSYDDVPQISKYYSKRTGFTYPLQYNASKAYIGAEAFYFSDNTVIPKYSTVKFINEAILSCEK